MADVAPGNTDGTDYPLQCFLYAPFGNYPVYNNLENIAAGQYIIGSELNSAEESQGVPMYPIFHYSGYLYLEIDALLPSNSIDLYVEMGRKYAVNTSNEVLYYYLSTTGWKELTVLVDSTYNLSCSGIVRVNVPEDITNQSHIMPGLKYWFCAAVKDSASIAQTIFLSTNGIEVERKNLAGLPDGWVPKLPGHTITKTKTAFPQISTVLQPFPSFGGKAAETTMLMNQRVSSRLKTKDRAVHAADYFNLIRQEFNDIYESRSVFDSSTGTTHVYVVKACGNWTDPYAFTPLVTAGKEIQIQQFLQARASAFSNIMVSNPDFQYVAVTATITIIPGYEPPVVKKNINQALNIYLSPWISSSSVQVQIFQEISAVQTAIFMKSIAGVAAVENVCFNTWMNGTSASLQQAVTVVPQNVTAKQKKVGLLKASALPVSAMVHSITINPSAS